MSKEIKKKKAVLHDFGLSNTLVDELFENKEFRNLRELDIFADDIIAKQLMMVQEEKDERF